MAQSAAPAHREAAVNYWPERAFALLLVAFVTLLVLAAFPVRTSIVGATDFKTIYASAWNLRHGVDAFSFQNVIAVLTANGVIPPPTAYGHNAVYPPFTLTLLAPLTFLPLVPAIWLWCIAGCVAIAAAFSALAQAAGDEFGLRRRSRFALILIAVVCPLFSFAAITQNVSLMAIALSLLVVTSRDRIWLRSIALALALLLKPHVALWPTLALLLQKRDSRRVAIQAILLSAAVAIASVLWLALNHQLAPQMASYAAGIRDEVSFGSMNPTRQDMMAAGLQITSLNTLIGFWQSSPMMLKGLCWTLLAGLAAILLWSSDRISLLPPDTLDRSRFIVTAAWCSFGMIVTYHRAHDALILMVLLPWLLPKLKPALGSTSSLTSRVLPWLLLALLLIFGAGIVPVHAVDPADGDYWIKHLLLYRQASVCAPRHGHSANDPDGPARSLSHTGATVTLLDRRSLDLANIDLRHLQHGLEGLRLADQPDELHRHNLP